MLSGIGALRYTGLLLYRSSLWDLWVMSLLMARCSRLDFSRKHGTLISVGLLPRLGTLVKSGFIALP